MEKGRTNSSSSSHSNCTTSGERRISRKVNNGKPKKPMKVVYISNPMKITASPSEFRALVQELTGQDAELPHISQYADGREGVGGSHGAMEARQSNDANGDGHGGLRPGQSEEMGSRRRLRGDDEEAELTSGDDESFILQQMMDNLSDIQWYGSGNVNL